MAAPSHALLTHAPQQRPKAKRIPVPQRAAKPKAAQPRKAKWRFSPTLIEGQGPSEPSAGVQPQLEVGPPQDEYEREADRVADRAISNTGSGAPAPGQEEAESRGALRRQAESAQEQGAAAQTLSLQRRQDEGDEPEAMQAAPLRRQQDESGEQEAMRAAPLQRRQDEGDEPEAMQAAALQRRQDEGDEQEAMQAAPLRRQQDESGEQEAMRAAALQRRQDEGDEPEAMQAAPQRRQQDEGDEQEAMRAVSLQRRAEPHEEAREVAQMLSLLRQDDQGDDEQEVMQAAPLQRQLTEEEDTGIPAAPAQRRIAEDELAQTSSLRREAAEAEDEDARPAASEPLNPEAVSEPLQRQEEFFDDPLPEQDEADELPALEDEQSVQPKRIGKSRDKGKPPPIPSGFKELLGWRRRAGGEALPRPLLHFMQARFGRSFDRVRIHRDRAASKLARSIRARAFTIGRHIFFKQGEFQPQTQKGQRLVAHELTHTLQQRGGLHRVQRELFDHAPMGEAEIAAGSASPDAAEEIDVKRLEAIFGWREGVTAPLLLDIIEQMVDQALQRLDSKQALAVFARGARRLDRSIRRTLRSTSHELRLEANQLDDGDRLAGQWTLKFFDGTRAEAKGGQRQPMGTDEQTVGVGNTSGPSTAPVAPASPLEGPPAPPPAASSTDTAVATPAGSGFEAADAPSLASESTAPAAAEAAPAPGGAGDGGAEAEVPRSPEEDPNFQAVEQRAANAEAKNAKHSEAGNVAANAKDAAELKPSENQGKAQAAQVDQMQRQQTPEFDKQKFIDEVLAKVRATAPKTMDEARNFASKGPQIERSVRGVTDSETERARGPLKDAAAEAPDVGAVTPRSPSELEPEPMGEPPAPVNAGQAVPPERPEAQVEAPFEQAKVDAEAKLAETGLPDPEKTLASSKDPELQAAVKAKDALVADADAGNLEFRSGERASLNQGKQEASALGNEKFAGMLAQRGDLIHRVLGEQKQGKSGSESKRESVSQAIETIYNDTKAKVETRLNRLKETVFSTFDSETALHLKTFTDQVTGAEARWQKKSFLERNAEAVVSYLFDIPTELEAELRAMREAFVLRMRGVVEKLAGIVSGELKEAKREVEAGRKAAQDKISSLGPELDDLKAQLTETFSAKFNALEAQVKATRNALVTGLAERYSKRLEQADKLLAEVRARNKTLVDEFYDIAAGAIQKLLELRDKLLSVFNEGVDTILQILADPITFLDNLISGVAQGIKNFASNILTHLKKGLLEWLTGTVSSAGIQLPDKFDAQGVFSLVMQLLGLTVDAIKERARRLWGNRIVDAIERGVAGAEKAKELFDILASQGVAGLFNYVKDQLAGLKEKILGEIAQAVSIEIVAAAIKNLLSLLTPASALVAAVIKIVNVVLFFISNASRIAELVQSIIGAVKALLAGDVAGLAQKVEQSLARAIPIVLDFLAALIGVGRRIIGTIKKILRAITKPIRKAIDAVLMRIKQALKKLLKKLGARGGRGRGRGAEDGRGAGRVISPKQAVREIKTALDKPTKATEPAQAIAEKERQAAFLKRQYQPQLAQGQRLAIKVDKSVAGVDKDGDIDITIRINPFDRAEPKVGADFLKRFKPDIAQAHAGARPLIVTGIGNIPRTRSNIQKWETVKRNLRKLSPTRELIEKPLLQGNRFGDQMSGSLRTAFQQVRKKEPTEGELSSLKGKVHGGEGAFGAPLQQLRAAVFDLRINRSALTASFKGAIATAPERESGDNIEKIQAYERLLKAAGKGAKLSFADPAAPTNAETDAARRAMVRTVAGAYSGVGRLAALDAQIIQAGLVASKFNRLIGEIFETWVAQNGIQKKRLQDPGPVFESASLDQRRIADFAEGDTLIEVKAIRDAGPGAGPPRPSAEQLSQAADYFKIITEPIPALVHAAGASSKPYRKTYRSVQYRVNNDRVAAAWAPDLKRVLGSSVSIKVG